jgi:hypothetical protein
VLPVIHRTALSIAAVAALSLGSLTANAVSVDLQVLLNGEQAGVYNGANLGCQDVAGTPTANCASTGPVWVGGSEGLRLDSWNLFLDEDPVVSATVAVTNLSLSTQQYTLLFTLPISPIPGATVVGGSIQGGATDNNGDGVTLSAPTASSFYTALIDAVAVQSLYTAPQTFSAGSFLSLNVPNLAFGTPIPSQAGPAALSSIAVRLDFLLTPGDSATFTGNFVVQPIPVPAAAWLLGSALGLFGVIRRKAPLA